MKQKTVITQLDREVLMMGDYVAVCWNGRYVKKAIEVESQMCEAKEWQRVSTRWAPGPYIDFVRLRTAPENSTYEADDSPVAGGIDPDIARQVAAELTKAAEYVEGLKST